MTEQITLTDNEKRLLMLSPQPFFEPRGAPLCVYLHIKALSELGYKVDLITYPLGKDVTVPGLTIYRALRLPFLKGVKPGPSLAKFPLDVVLFLRGFVQLCHQHYTEIHVHEEACFLGIILARLFCSKVLYYMHCDLGELVEGSKLGSIPGVSGIAHCLQRFMIHHADAVITFYPEITRKVKELAPDQKVFFIPSTAVDEGISLATAEEGAALRQQLDIGQGPVLLYTGTLEDYQGLDMMLESAVRVRAQVPDVKYVVVGGKPEQIAELEQLKQRLLLGGTVYLVGQRPLEEMPRFMAMADILVSPRNKGTHIPLKLYSYLRSGKPVLATNIVSNTQILTPKIATMVDPSAEAFAEGTLAMLENMPVAQAKAQLGQQHARQKYGWNVFVKRNKVANEAFATVG